MHPMGNTDWLFGGRRTCHFAWVRKKMFQSNRKFSLNYRNKSNKKKHVKRSLYWSQVFHGISGFLPVYISQVVLDFFYQFFPSMNQGNKKMTNIIPFSTVFSQSHLRLNDFGCQHQHWNGCQNQRWKFFPKPIWKVDKLFINWCRISSIHGSGKIHHPGDQVEHWKYSPRWWNFYPSEKMPPAGGFKPFKK